MKYDSIVIGAGISGLTSALVLARHGYKVALLEKSSHIGPLLRRFKRGKVWCDPGLHYTGGMEKSETLSVLLKYMGMDEMVASNPMNAKAFDILAFDGKEINIPNGMQNIQETLSSSFPQSAKAIALYIEKIKELMNATPFITFNHEFETFSKNYTVNQTLLEFLTNAGAEEEFIRVMGQYGEYLYGVSANDVPFQVHAMVMGTFFKSARTLPDGGDSLIDVFEKRLQEEGVDILPNTAAIGLDVDDKRTLRGVQISDNETLECSNCICTIHPQLLIDLLPKTSVRPAYFSRLKNLENTNSAFALYLDVDEVPKKVTESNLYQINTQSMSLDHDRALAVMACSPAETGHSKKGLCILKESINFSDLVKNSYEDKNKEHDKILKEKERGKILGEFLQLFPEMKGKFKIANCSTPLTYERYTGSPHGSMYGVKQSVHQHKLSPLTSISGFYLAGHSILMPGVIGASVSGFLAVSNIVGLRKLWNDIKKCCQEE